MQSQATSAAQRQTSAPAAAPAFSLAGLASTATSQGPRPRAIKSQHSQPQQLTDALIHQQAQQQQALQHDVLKTEAAKLAEASKLAELRYTMTQVLLELIGVRDGAFRMPQFDSMSVRQLIECICTNYE